MIPYLLSSCNNQAQNVTQQVSGNQVWGNLNTISQSVDKRNVVQKWRLLSDKQMWILSSIGWVGVAIPTATLAVQRFQEWDVIWGVAFMIGSLATAVSKAYTLNPASQSANISS